MTVSRRKAIRLLLGTGAATVGVGAVGLGWLRHKFNPNTPLSFELPAAGVGSGLLPATPACASGTPPTPKAIEGPFYRPASPERAILRDAQTLGQPLTIRGRVLTQDCRPVGGAVLDFWSCDGRGVYDNEGFGLRGHQFTDREGHYLVETVKPSDYKQYGVHRAPHIHVKVQGQGTALLTTQLFFPGEPQNASDWLFDDSLVLNVTGEGGGPLVGKFDFVLRLA